MNFGLWRIKNDDAKAKSQERTKILNELLRSKFKNSDHNYAQT